MTSKFKKLMLAVLLLALVPVNALAGSTWISGETHFYWRVGLTGGGMALDAISGVSMGQFDSAAVVDLSGTSVYFYQVSMTGNASGTTVESSPDWISPNSLQPLGDGAGGVSMWKLLGPSGVTGTFKTLIIDNRNFTGTDIDKVKAYPAALTAHTGASVVSGASMTVNQNAVSIGAAFLGAGSGDSAFVVVPYSLVMTGVSLMVPNTTSAAGVSIHMASAVIPATDGTNGLADISNEGGTVGNKSGTTRIPAGSVLNFVLKSMPSGASTWTVQVMGRKE